MRKLNALFVVTLIVLLPFSARATSHGSGGAVAVRSASTAPATKPASQARSSKPANPATVAKPNRPNNPARPSVGGNAPSTREQSRFTNATPTGVAAYRSNYVHASSMHHGVIIWWSGWYAGVYCVPGWYYPYAIYPGVWYPVGYYGAYYGYQYNIARETSQSGIKFELEEIPKEDRKAVDEANVYVSSQGEQAGGTLGIVSNFSGTWHKALPLTPGTYDVKVVLGDGREINMAVEVQSQRVTHVALRADKSPQETPQSAGASPAGTSAQSALAPAPAPSAVK